MKDALRGKISYQKMNNYLNKPVKDLKFKPKLKIQFPS